MSEELIIKYKVANNRAIEPIYKIINKIQSTGFWYCRCHEFFGCPTISSFLKNDERYCFVCQFQDEFSFFELCKVKRIWFHMKRYHEHILDRIQKMKPFYSEENYFWSRGIHFTVMNNYLNEMIDYLFNLDVQVNKCFKRFVDCFFVFTIPGTLFWFDISSFHNIYNMHTFRVLFWISLWTKV